MTPFEAYWDETTQRPRKWIKMIRGRDGEIILQFACRDCGSSPVQYALGQHYDERLDTVRWSEGINPSSGGIDPCNYGALGGNALAAEELEAAAERELHPDTAMLSAKLAQLTSNIAAATGVLAKAANSIEQVRFPFLASTPTGPPPPEAPPPLHTGRHEPANPLPRQGGFNGHRT